MKQDSYARFLKSDQYKACIMAAMEGKVAPYSTESSDKIDDRKVPIALFRSTLLSVEPFMLSVNETVAIFRQIK